MSRAQVNYLNKQIAEANRAMVWAKQLFSKSRDLEDLVHLVEAQAYLRGLCKAMAHACQQTDIQLDGSWRSELQTAMQKIRET